MLLGWPLLLCLAQAHCSPSLGSLPVELTRLILAHGKYGSAASLSLTSRALRAAAAAACFNHVLFLDEPQLDTLQDKVLLARTAVLASLHAETSRTATPPSRIAVVSKLFLTCGSLSFSPRLFRVFQNIDPAHMLTGLLARRLRHDFARLSRGSLADACGSELCFQWLYKIGYPMLMLGSKTACRTVYTNTILAACRMAYCSAAHSTALPRQYLQLEKAAGLLRELASLVPGTKRRLLRDVSNLLFILDAAPEDESLLSVFHNVILKFTGTALPPVGAATLQKSLMDPKKDRFYRLLFTAMKLGMYPDFVLQQVHRWQERLPPRRPACICVAKHLAELAAILEGLPHIAPGSAIGLEAWSRLKRRAVRELFRRSDRPVHCSIERRIDAATGDPLLLAYLQGCLPEDWLSERALQRAGTDAPN